MLAEEKCILERLEVIQRTMGLTGSGLVEDYREMILGQVAEQIDATRLFAESRAGQRATDVQVDDWIHGAVQSVESAFGLRTGTDWPYDPGWLLVYALRWLGRSRRLSSPDSMAVCFARNSGEVLQLTASKAMTLATQAEPAALRGSALAQNVEAAARRLAQQSLKACASNRDTLARGAAGLSLLFAALMSD